MTDWQFYLYRMEQEVRKKILEDNPVLTEEQLNQMVQDELNAGKQIAKNKEGTS